MRDGIFVSYSHADRAWLAELQQVLKSLPDDVRITLWDDTRIAPGSFRVHVLRQCAATLGRWELRSMHCRRQSGDAASGFLASRAKSQ